MTHFHILQFNCGFACIRLGNGLGKLIFEYAH